MDYSLVFDPPLDMKLLKKDFLEAMPLEMLLRTPLTMPPPERLLLSFVVFWRVGAAFIESPTPPEDPPRLPTFGGGNDSLAF